PRRRSAMRSPHWAPSSPGRWANWSTGSPDAPRRWSPPRTPMTPARQRRRPGSRRRAGSARPAHRGDVLREQVAEVLDARVLAGQHHPLDPAGLAGDRLVEELADLAAVAAGVAVRVGADRVADRGQGRVGDREVGL